LFAVSVALTSHPGIIILAKTITKIVQYTYLKDPTTSWCKFLYPLPESLLFQH
jgi:hypothetical protein